MSGGQIDGGEVDGGGEFKRQVWWWSIGVVMDDGYRSQVVSIVVGLGWINDAVDSGGEDERTGGWWRTERWWWLWRIGKEADVIGGDVVQWW